MKTKIQLNLLIILLFRSIYSGEDNFFGNDSTSEDEIVVNEGRLMDVPGTVCAPLFSPKNFIDLLIHESDSGKRIIDILKNNLYKRTNNINSRPINSLPALLPSIHGDYHFQFRLIPFYNQTSKMFFYKDDNINDYMDLKNSNIANEVDTIVEELGLKDFIPDIDFPYVASLFAPINLQERRTGFNFGFYKPHNDWLFIVRTNVFYAEHNFFMSMRDIDKIKDEPLFAVDPEVVQDGPNTEQNVEDFIKQNLVNDRVGLGSTTFHCLYNLNRTNRLDNWFGLWILLPTEFNFANGIIGGTFPKCVERPQLDLLGIINLISCANALDDDQKDLPGAANPFKEKVNAIALNLGSATLQQLSSMTANLPLDARKDCGLGLYSDILAYISNHMKFHTINQFHYIFPHHGISHVLADKSVANFNIESEENEYQIGNLDFVNNQILDTFFPYCVKSLIQPGFEVRSSSRFIWESELFTNQRWFAGLGLDFWYKFKEKLKFEKNLDPKFTAATLALANSSSAVQIKIYAELLYNLKLDFSLDYNIALVGDYTVFNRGIGKDFTLGLSFNMKF